jgi:hypothetical protein
MILSGGDPDVMDFPHFLDVSYALLAEEHQRINPLKDLLSLSTELGPALPSQPRVQTTVAQSNEASYAMLGGMMAGVTGSPLKKPRKA